MDFTGRIFFDLGVDTWRFFGLIAAGSASGVDIRLDWWPCAIDGSSNDQALRAAAIAKAMSPDRYGAFIQALLILRHEEGVAVIGESEIAQAAVAVGIDHRALAAALADGGGSAELRRMTGEALGLGVSSLPALYRHGPVLQITVNGAAIRGDVVGRLETIDQVLGDDGLWGLVKP